MENTKRVKVVLYCLLVIVLVGLFITIGCKMRSQRRNTTDFSYGVVSSTLTAENIVWTEFPQFRNVDFVLNGEMKVTVPQDFQLSIAELKEADSLKEIAREKKRLADGAGQILYDEVTYAFQNAEINASVSKIYGSPEKDGACGYALSYTMADKLIVVGYILPMSNEFLLCTGSESEYWKYTQNIDFGFLKLSRTYQDENVLSVKERYPKVRLERKKNFDFSIINEGDSPWQYSYLPAFEVWNQGVWLELISLHADPGVLKECGAKQTVDISLPKEVFDAYPYFSPGLYRIVIHGQNGTYAATEGFVIE